MSSPPATASASSKHAEYTTHTTSKRGPHGPRCCFVPHKDDKHQLPIIWQTRSSGTARRYRFRNRTCPGTDRRPDLPANADLVAHLLPTAQRRVRLWQCAERNFHRTQKREPQRGSLFIDLRCFPRRPGITAHRPVLSTCPDWRRRRWRPCRSGSRCRAGRRSGQCRRWRRWPGWSG